MATTRVSATSITLLLFVVVCLLIHTSSCDLSISIAEYVNGTLTPSTKIVIDESRGIQIAPNTTYVITCEGGNDDLNDIPWTSDQNNIAMMNVDNADGTESKVFYDKTETTTSKLYLWNFNRSLSGSYTCHSTVGDKTLNIIENNPAIILSETYLPRKESGSESVYIKFFLSGVPKSDSYTLTWYFEGIKLDSDLQSSLKLILSISSTTIILQSSKGFGKQNDGVYTGVLTTPAGTSNASFILDVQFRPSIILSSDCNCSTDNMIIINENSNLTLSCVDTNADPPPQFTWFKDGIKDPDNLIMEHSSVVVEQISESESQLKFFNIMLENAGEYYCKANNSFSEKNENVIICIPYVRIWYSYPLPGSILKDNTAISVYTMVNEIRCYSGDTAANNNNTDIISPPGSSSLVFSNSAAGRLVKSGSESISSVDNGIYTCVYSVDSEEYQMSFGVYSRDREPDSDDGTPLSIQSVDYIIDELTMTVTCTSTGWPATQVTWIKDDDILTSDSTYSMSQTITDRMESIYENVLNVMGSSQDDLLGTYECEVKCLRHNDQTIDTALGSVTIQSVGNLMVVITTLDYAEVGSTYELNCTVIKNGGSPTITWKKSSVTLVTNTTAGIQVGDLVDQGDTISVTLTLGPLHQSHDGQYSCTGQVNSAMGTATVGVDVGIPTLPISITPDIAITATVGESVTLECHTSLPESLNGNIASINWTHNGAEVTEGVINMLSQGESSLDLGAVVSAEAGTYTCNVQIQSEFVDIDSHLIATNTTNLTIQMPVPSEPIIAPQPIVRQYFSGVEIRFTCFFTIDKAIGDDTNAVVTADWRKGDSLLTGDDRLSVTAPELFKGETYLGHLDFDYLTQLDSDNYSCEVFVFVTSNLNSEFITDSSESSSIMINVEGPTPEVNLTSSTLRLPTHPDYNQAILTCTATLLLPPEIDELEFDKVFRWTMSGTDVTSYASTPTNPRGIESVSTLTRELTIAGDIVFRCEVNISIPGDPVVSNSNSVTITVLGPSNPVQPTNLTIVDITYYKVTIQWTVTSIAYTPEQYIILYGLTESSLTQESDMVNGTMDFRSINDTYSVMITELDYNTVYYYQVRSTNTEGSTNSDVVMFQTPKKPPTAPPENFIITVINSTALKLQWDLPPEEHRNGIIIAYTLSCEEMISDEYLLVTSPDFPLIVNKNGSVSLILNGFRPGTPINCTVSASNLAATGPSTTSSAITDEEPPAGPPLNFTILDKTSYTFTVTWSPTDPFLRYGVILSYSLICEEIEGGHIPPSYPRMFTGPPISNVTVDDLRPFTDYNCSLIAINSAGNSDPTTDTSITDEDAPESYPRDFTITATKLRSLTFLWKPVDKRLQNGLIINYTITCNSSSILPMEISPDDLIEDSNGVYNYTIFSFTPATVYMCSIYANTSVGAGPEISAIGVTLEEFISTTLTSSVSIVTTSMTSTATQGTSNIGLIISLLSCILCVVLTCVVVIISILIYKRGRKSKHDDMSTDAIQTKNIYSPAYEMTEHNTSNKKCDENIVTKMSITYGMVENKPHDTSQIYEEIDTPEYKIPVISTDVPITSSHGVYETII